MLRPFRRLTVALYVLKEKLSRKSEVSRWRSRECASAPHRWSLCLAPNVSRKKHLSARFSLKIDCLKPVTLTQTNSRYVYPKTVLFILNTVQHQKDMQLDNSIWCVCTSIV